MDGRAGYGQAASVESLGETGRLLDGDPSSLLELLPRVPHAAPPSSQRMASPANTNDDPYDYRVYADNPIATQNHQNHQQQESNAAPTTTAPAAAAAAVIPPPTPPKPAHHSPASSNTAAAHRTSPPPRSGSFKAFASSPLSGAGLPSMASASSAPFLVLSSGGADGGPSGAQRGSTLTDGPRSPGPNSSTNIRHSTHQQSTQPTPRSSHSSSASSSIPATGSGSLSTSTSSTTPPLANATSSSSSSGGFVSPFTRSGTRPLLTPSPASGSIGSMAGLAFAGLPAPSSSSTLPPSTSTSGPIQPSTSGSVGSGRGSMILYRLSAGEEGVFSPSATGGGSAFSGIPNGPAPPGLAHMYGGSSLRHSAFYSETDSLTLDGDSKYPAFMPSNGGGGGSGVGTPRGSVLGLSANTPGSPGALAIASIAPGAPAGTTPFTLGMRSSLAELASVGRAQGGLVAYVYDPDEDDDDDDDDDYEYEDGYYAGDDKGRKEREEKRREMWVHDPSEVNALYAGVGRGGGKHGEAGSPPGTPDTPTPASSSKSQKADAVHTGATPAHPQGTRRPPYRPPHHKTSIGARGIINITTLVALTVGLLCLFIVLPVAKAFSDNGVATKILGNTRINATGQAERRELRNERREWRIDFEQER